DELHLEWARRAAARIRRLSAAPGRRDRKRGQSLSRRPLIERREELVLLLLGVQHLDRSLDRIHVREDADDAARDPRAEWVGRLPAGCVVEDDRAADDRVVPLELGVGGRLALRLALD